jgi:hypothetical protein
MEKNVRGDSIARPEARHAGADVDNFASELVSQNDRRLLAGQRVWRTDRDEQRTGSVLFEVGTADSASIDADKDLARCQSTRRRHVFNADVVPSVPNHRLHALLPNQPMPPAGGRR